ncbi:MAG: alpha-ketoglutarate-dependent dioxygenase AlkB [Chitinophagales bacterium]|nr:alpha-ketoglutarate-dependent dioxygenase AlkB [Chitinophagales bacterium]
MDLFNQDIHSDKNRLPYDGIVQYYGKIMDSPTAINFYNILFNSIQWQHDEVMILGRKIITKRKVAWYGDKAYSYTYSNITKQAKIWTSYLLKLKNIVEAISKHTFNSCLLNLYHDGSEGLSYHSDNEKMLEENGAIATLSLGAERRFLFKHRMTQEKVEILLESGSLLIMKGNTQKHWLHSIPTSKKIFSPRISLTFRTIIQ